MSVNYSAGLSPYENKGKCGIAEKHDEHFEFITKCHKLSELIKDSKLTIVHTGAGISTSAGIPDFRGPKGVWTLENQGKSPECSITFDQAIPTFSHRCLVLLEKLGFIHYVVSQNVDGLHLRSGFPRDRLAELHGNMFVQKCQLCGREVVLDTVSPTMGLRLTGNKCSYTKNRGRCRGLLRDTILDWEDALPVTELDMSEKISKCSQLSIVLGSSLQIFPAANLPLLTKRNQGKLVIVNLQPTRMDKHADLHIHGFIDDVFKVIADDLKILVPEYEEANVCLNSSNNLPELYTLALRKSFSSRKRKSKTDIKIELDNNEEKKSPKEEISTSKTKNHDENTAASKISNSNCDLVTVIKEE